MRRDHNSDIVFGRVRLSYISMVKKNKTKKGNHRNDFELTSRQNAVSS